MEKTKVNKENNDYKKSNLFIAINFLLLTMIIGVFLILIFQLPGEEEDDQQEDTVQQDFAETFQNNYLKMESLGSLTVNDITINLPSDLLFGYGVKDTSVGSFLTCFDEFDEEIECSIYSISTGVQDKYFVSTPGILTLNDYFRYNVETETIQIGGKDAILTQLQTDFVTNPSEELTSGEPLPQVTVFASACVVEDKVCIVTSPTYINPGNSAEVMQEFEEFLTEI
jgi:hypothetical protein